MKEGGSFCTLIQPLPLFQSRHTAQQLPMPHTPVTGLLAEACAPGCHQPLLFVVSLQTEATLSPVLSQSCLLPPAQRQRHHLQHGETGDILVTTVNVYPNLSLTRRARNVISTKVL